MFVFKSIVFACVLYIGTAAPQSYNAPQGSIPGGRGAAAGVGAVFNQAGGGYSGGSSSPGGFRSGPVVAILRDDRNGPEGGHYDFAYETADGISRNEQGSPSGPQGSVVQQGGWSFTFPDGTLGQFSFVADENGYRVESPLLPVAPPMPAHALEQIARSERERAAGIVHDGQYRGEGLQASQSSFNVQQGGFNTQRGSSGGGGEYGR